MRITSGKVIAGHIVAEGEPLPDGALVTVLSRDSDESFVLGPAAESELLLSLAEADRGELIAMDEVLKVFRESE